jgi:hypothetical protein
MDSKIAENIYELKIAASARCASGTLPQAAPNRPSNRQDLAEGAPGRDAHRDDGGRS